jgi:hypothetical protein
MMINLSDVNDNKVKEAVLKTVVFFDLFDYPLSAIEIKKYLSLKASLAEIIKALDKIKEIENKNGFFFLKSRGEIIDTRQKRHNYSLRKIKIARRFSRLFSLLPWVKTIILSNSIGQYNLRDGSDIDFFIITAPRRIWLTRLFCAGIAAFLHSRPSAQNKRDKICLSFYITTANLNLDEFKLKEDDPYFFYWLRSFVLLYNKDKVYEKFLAANNIVAPDATAELIEPEMAAQNFIFNGFEKIAKTIQLIIMSSALKQAANNSIGVIINDAVLKLYLRDNRQAYAEKYGNKIRQIFTENN